jgi:hypothetical protein
MGLTRQLSRGGSAVLVALLAGLLIAACGGSSNASKTTATKNASKTASSSGKVVANRSALTTCLKQHGVTLPKRPAGGYGFRSGTTTNGTPTTTVPHRGRFPGGGGSAGGGGGFFGGGGGGFARGNSKLAKALQACRSKLGSSGFGGLAGGRGGPYRGGSPGANGRSVRPGISTAALKSYVACIRKNGDPSMPEPDTSSKAKAPFPASAEQNSKFVAANKKCESILLKAFRHPAAGAAGASGGAPTISGTSTVSSA